MVGIVKHFLSEEVALIDDSDTSGKRRCLLELRPFPSEASIAAGCPPLIPPLPNTCHHFKKQACSYGAHCYNAHAPPREFRG